MDDMSHYSDVQKKMYALAMEAYDLAVSGDFSLDVMRKQDEIFNKAKQISDSVGEGLKEGKLISWGVGDGKAFYFIAQIRPRTVLLWFLPMGDGYCSSEVSSKDTISRKKAEEKVRQADAFKSLFGSRAVAENQAS